MSLPLIGAFLGLLLAGIEMIFLRILARRVELPETRKALTVAGLSQFVIFPIVGWFVADYIGG